MKMNSLIMHDVSALNTEPTSNYLMFPASMKYELEQGIRGT